MSTTKTRLDIREELLAVLLKLGIVTDGESGHLYFQPPETVKMRYPAIVYELSSIPARHADNQPYKLNQRFSVTAIDKDPDSRLPFELAALPTASFNRFFTVDNLNHWVFTMHV